MNIDQLRQGVNQALKSEVAHNCLLISEIDDQLVPIANSLQSYLSEGKRFRPLFALIGFLGANGELTPQVYQAAASLEFLQASALIHDDLMDGSDTRRGKPAIHRHFENLHQTDAMNGLATQFGESAAVLLGDLALVWSDQMLNTSGISTESLLAAHRIHDEMRVELMAGQYLDVREAGERTHSVERSLRIARYKSGKYSIERPLHMGAAIGNPSSYTALSPVLSAYGLPLGEAFQLRDDLLGVFGDPEVTGKPAGDDLREGKRTVLIAMTLENLSGDDRATLLAELGNPELTPHHVDELRTIIRSSGAVEKVESLISQLMDSSLAAIDSPLVAEESRELLHLLAHAAVSRKA